MTFFKDPFFWALVSMFGLVGACAVVGSKRVGRHSSLGLLVVAIFDLGRFVLVLPFCDQPRFELEGWSGLIGSLILIGGGYLALAPCFTIKPLNITTEDTALQTTGLYRLVRNPIYLGELLWCLGWAIIFRSIIGVALVPVWWAGLLILILIEEESLERCLGSLYRDYRQQVRGRIIPGLPI